MGRYLFGSSLEPPYTPLCIGVILLAFHSNGNTRARLKQKIFRLEKVQSLFLIVYLVYPQSKQIFFSSGVVSRLWTVSTVGICSENVLSVGLG